MVHCIHITPELPPTVGGIADYSAILSRRLEEDLDVSVEPVIVLAGTQEVSSSDVEFPVVNLSGQCSSEILANKLEWLISQTNDAVLLLEYSGYGYSKHGAPLWLVRGLHRARKMGGSPLVTIFHELYASSYKPWNRRFWLMPFQRYVTSQLAHLCDGLLANWDEAARWLSQRVEDCPVRVSPTFSNVREPATLSNYSERKPYAVCFGGDGRKIETYVQHGTELEQLLSEIGIERIVDIGSRVSEKFYHRMKIPVEPKGLLPAEEISGILREASLGILKHPLHCLKKSGIWASYAAHGVPTVLAAERQPVEGLDEETHYLLLGACVPNTNQLSSISGAVWQWYTEKAHSHLSAKRVGKLINELL